MGCLCHLMQMAIGQPAGRRAATLRSSHRCRALRPGVERRNLSIRLISARLARNAEMDERYADNSDRSRTTASRRTGINLRRTTIAYLSIHRREHERQWWRPIDVRHANLRSQAVSDLYKAEVTLGGLCKVSADSVSTLSSGPMPNQSA